MTVARLLQLDINGYGWLYMVINSMVMDGDANMLWMTIEYLQLLMVINGYVWLLMTINGYGVSSMVINGY